MVGLHQKMNPGNRSHHYEQERDQVYNCLAIVQFPVVEEKTDRVEFEHNIFTFCSIFHI